MSKYRKKPVVIDAVQFIAGQQPGELVDDVIAGTIRFTEAGTVLILTLEGVMEAQSGDWIIRGVKGELYSCKPDVFAMTYERADQSGISPQTLPATCESNDEPLPCPFCLNKPGVMNDFGGLMIRCRPCGIEYKPLKVWNRRAQTLTATCKDLGLAVDAIAAQGEQDSQWRSHAFAIAERVMQNGNYNWTPEEWFDAMVAAVSRPNAPVLQGEREAALYFAASEINNALYWIDKTEGLPAGIDGGMIDRMNAALAAIDESDWQARASSTAQPSDKGNAAPEQATPPSPEPSGYQNPFACMNDCAQGQCRNRTTGCRGECEVRAEREREAGEQAAGIFRVPVVAATQPNTPPGYVLVQKERSYDMRVQALLHFNTAEQNGKDRDDALEAAWVAQLAASQQEGVSMIAASTDTKGEG
jgi:hypothetical protein